MGRWKRFGIIIDQYKYDHGPDHVHVFEDGQKPLKFNIRDWEVLEGTLTSKAKKALEFLREEGILCVTRNLKK